MNRIFLSPPHMTECDRNALLAAFDSNWIAPVGPDLERFEAAVASVAGVDHAVALSSGSAGLHLALQLIGVGPGDEVIVPSLTFAATANAVTYLGATPTFVDSEAASWNLDPDLLAEGLAEAAAAGALPAAVVTVDLYGQCADYDRILAACAEYDVPVIEDAAEALGATYRGRPAGSFGQAGVFSFNGNKILTTSGGGMLVAPDESLVQRARHLATQAREPEPHYEHHELGSNYRLSNLLAALGHAQVSQLAERIARRREIEHIYRSRLGAIDGIGFMPHPDTGTPNHWLTVITVDEQRFGLTPHELIAKLAAADIEARPAWKPMHLQPIFAELPMRGGAVAETVFATGVCLPSGSAMTDADQSRVIEAIEYR